MGIQKTPRQMIKNALAKIAIWNPADEDYTYGLDIFNNILATLSTEGINVQVVSEDTFIMTAGKGVYTIGISGDIDTVSPEELISCLVSVSETSDYQVLPSLSLEEYNSIPNKLDKGIPGKMCYIKNYPLGKLIFYPAPDMAYTSVLSSKKVMTSASDLDTNYDIHQKYYDLLEGLLTVGLAPRFNSVVDPSISFLTVNLKNTIQNSNVRNVPPVNLYGISKSFYR